MTAPRVRVRVRVGVLAVQGGVAEHARMLEHLGANAVLVRRERELQGPDGPRLDALVLPGGESGAQDRLLRRWDLVEPVRRLIGDGLPTLGTCAGLILLAREVHDPAPEQQGWGLLDVAVRRNAIGSQVASSEAEFRVHAAGVTGAGASGAVRGALIRAPEIVDVGPRARTIVAHGGRILGATSATPGDRDHSEESASEPSRTPLGSLTGIAFHPELCGDPAFHRALLAQVR